MLKRFPQQLLFQEAAMYLQASLSEGSAAQRRRELGKMLLGSFLSQQLLTELLPAERELSRIVPVPPWLFWKVQIFDAAALF